ncbi:hypothetical protein JQ595_20295 [Bradyrhizobium japonicum]|uniref:hypothetical protein n=1 Tax=Bradyrhizobium japonicum TaxID=375 RepID=UPI001BA8BF1E|nr:hypothetical protein [Bradyrhizobium japonicum]MBR0731088.1 hypothetical protein [Bradyrhizobium japonicum]
MSSSFETIVRADDFLYCQFEFVNLALRTASTGAQQLERASGGPAFIIMRLPPQNVAEQIARDGTSADFPYQAGLSGPSRLAWRLPDTFTRVDYRLDAVLAQIDNAELVSVDAVAATVIEFPDRLLLVPQPSTRSAHRSKPFTSSQTRVTEIWHTTLQRGSPHGNSILFKPLANPADASAAARPFVGSLTKANRDDILKLSQESADPHVIASSLLRLTSLGATAKLKSNWVADPNISLAAWEHDAELGRDYYSYTLEQGFVCPIGHRVTIATVVERKIASHFGNPVAELVQSQKILTILDTERDYEALKDLYPGDGREMPFTRICIASAPRNIDSNDAPIQMDLVLVDRAGNRIQCSAATLFVPVGAASTTEGPLKTLRQRYTEPSATSPTSQPVSLSLVSLGGQRMAMTANEDGLGDTSLNVESLTFGIKLPSELRGFVVPAFLPFMAKADAKIPALEQMVGTTAGATPAAQRRATQIEFHPNYLAAGLDSRQVYAKLTPIPGITIPSERAGGLTAPTFPAIDGLSRLTGPVSKVDGGMLRADDLVKDTKLLGVFSLASIIEDEIGAVPIDPSKVHQIFDEVERDRNLFLPRPIMTTIEAGGGVETRFVWKPRIKAALPHPLKPLGSMELILRGRISKLASGDRPAFEVNGALRNFELSFSLLGGDALREDVLGVQFDALEFVSTAARKVDIKLSVRGVDFRGTMKFVQKLQTALPMGNLAKGGAIQTLPDGVVIRYAVPIPVIPLGLLNIQNLVVSTSVSLSFVPDKPAAVRFALSERNNPFQVSVSIFGGTGFFALEVSTNDVVKIEAALEFGGVASLNLIVVRGGVYLLAGIYLSIKSDGGLLIEGHLRLGGFVDVLGLISVAIEVYIALTYIKERNVLFGTGRLTVGVKLLFFSESFSFEITKEVPGFGEAPTQTFGLQHETIALAVAGPVIATAVGAGAEAPRMTVDQFKAYCSAFS